MTRKRILISGGGIAGLTLGILLQQSGWQPLVIERDRALRNEGYMMDFFGTGWDVAERMGLIEAIRAIRYPIDRIEFMDSGGTAFFSVPIERMRDALEDRYNYLRRSDLEQILYRKALACGVKVRFGCSLRSLEQQASSIDATFEDGTQDSFALAAGADGIHSRVRELSFGPEQQFARELGFVVAAFHFPDAQLPLGRALILREGLDRIAAFYPLGEGRADATLLFTQSGGGEATADRHSALVRERFAGDPWVAQALAGQRASAPLFFDPTRQIAMPQWHRGRVVLIGDACGCLTLLAGQGSHMAMAGAWVLARELNRHGEPEAAFAAYQQFLKPQVERKQREAAFFSRYFVPRKNSRPWLRHLAIRALFSRIGLRLAMGNLGAKSVLS